MRGGQPSLAASRRRPTLRPRSTRSVWISSSHVARMMLGRPSAGAANRFPDRCSSLRRRATSRSRDPSSSCRRQPITRWANGLSAAARRHQDEGWLLFAHAWRPTIARGQLIGDRRCGRGHSLGVDLVVDVARTTRGRPLAGAETDSPDRCSSLRRRATLLCDRSSSCRRQPIARWANGSVRGPEHPGWIDEPEWLENIHDVAYFYLDFLEAAGSLGSPWSAAPWAAGSRWRWRCAIPSRLEIARAGQSRGHRSRRRRAAGGHFPDAAGRLIPKTVCRLEKLGAGTPGRRRWTLEAIDAAQEPPHHRAPRLGAAPARSLPAEVAAPHRCAGEADLGSRRTGSSSGALSRTDTACFPRRKSRSFENCGHLPHVGEGRRSSSTSMQ